MSKEANDQAAAAIATLGVLAKMASGGNPLYNPEVDRSGDKVVVPEGAHLPDVIKALQRKHDEENQKISLSREVRCQPWDGAMALIAAIKEVLGFATMNSTYSFFEGVMPPQMLDIEVEYGKKISYPWGEFALPAMEGATISTGFALKPNGRIDFRCEVSCKKRYESRIRRMLEVMEQFALRSQLHNGKIFALTFVEKETWQGTVIFPDIQFFQLSDEQPIYRQSLELAIERNIIVPMRHAKEMREMGEKLKRGVLLAGPYGTGKTLLASKLAREAQRAGWTFIYVKEAKQLRQALEFAHGYQPVVVFCEDVDRVAGTQRTDAVNDILNQLDGIDTKGVEILTVLTSNNPQHINPAMRRPGRIDVLMEVSAPDAEACERMLRHYGGASIRPEADLSKAGAILTGQSPAKVRETVTRAKMETLRRTGHVHEPASGDDLAVVAEEVVLEAGLFVDKDPPKPDVSQVADGFEATARILRQRLNGRSNSDAIAYAYNVSTGNKKEARG